MDGDWISRKEAGRRLGCAPSTLAGMVERGEVMAAPLPPGATRRVRREASIDAESVGLLRRRRELERALAHEREAERRSRLAWRRPPDDGQVWLSVRTTAVLVGVDRTRVQQMIKAETMPATKRGRRWWVRRADAEVVANARRFRAAQDASRKIEDPGL